MKCNRDCFNCPYEDCIEDELTAADYRELAEIDREIINPKDRRAKKLAAQKKAYYEANRDKVAAQQKAYREANRDKVAAQKKAWYEANRDKVAAYQKAYRDQNRERYNDYMREYMRAYHAGIRRTGRLTKNVYLACEGGRSNDRSNDNERQGVKK